jgi:argininosuccinate lyase
LPMTYNRDLQEDKPLLFDSAQTLTATISVFSGMLDSTRFNEKACLKAVEDVQLLATELADFLVKKGVPFREAHHAIGAAVKYAEQQQKPLNRLNPNEWKSIHPQLKDAGRELNLSRFFTSRDSLIGAPGAKQVELQLKHWKKKLR